MAGATQATVPQVLAVRAVLADDGDNDGWADTRETVSMRVVVRNVTGMDLTGLVFLATTDSPAIAGFIDNRIVFGDLADGEARLSDEAFTFVVADVDRVAMSQMLSATFRFATYSDQPCLEGLVGTSAELTIDLDLDASAGSGPTTFFESFETGFGAFTTMHLDETLNPPPGDLDNHELGVAAADGSTGPRYAMAWTTTATD